jgi:hypothetical protein
MSFVAFAAQTKQEQMRTDETNSEKNRSIDETTRDRYLQKRRIVWRFLQIFAQLLKWNLQLTLLALVLSIPPTLSHTLSIVVALILDPTPRPCVYQSIVLTANGETQRSPPN